MAEWYIYAEGGWRGPATVEKLHRLIITGKIDAETPVRHATWDHQSTIAEAGLYPLGMSLVPAPSPSTTSQGLQPTGPPRPASRSISWESEEASLPQGYCPPYALAVIVSLAGVSLLFLLFAAAIVVFLGGSTTNDDRATAPRADMSRSTSAVSGERANTRAGAQASYAPTERVSEKSEIRETPTDVFYEIVDTKDEWPVRMTYCVEVQLVDDRLPRKQELGMIANELRKTGPESGEFYVSFYLPGMRLDQAAYGITESKSSSSMETYVLFDRVPKKYYPILCEMSGIEPRSPTRFQNVDQLVNCLAEYSIFSKTSRTLDRSSGRPVLRLAPTIYPFDSPDAIRNVVRMEVVYSVICFFIHTDYQEISVHAIPVGRTNPQGGEGILLEDITCSFTVDRKTVLEAMHWQVGIDSLDELVGVYDGSGDNLTYDPDAISASFESCLFNDPGYNRLDAVFADLTGE